MQVPDKCSRCNREGTPEARLELSPAHHVEGFPDNGVLLGFLCLECFSTLMAWMFKPSMDREKSKVRSIGFQPDAEVTDTAAAAAYAASKGKVN
jgi:hypothetical protein